MPKLTDRTALNETPAVGDLLHIVDISDTTDSSSGTSKKITTTNLLASKADASHSHATSDITSGTFDNARIAEGSVTQHQSALTVTASQVSDFDTEVANNAAVTANTAKNSYPSEDATKVSYLTVTQAVNLDQLETDVAALANGMVYKGNWDASTGTFPASADTGAFYTVSVAGTVDSVEFAIGDRLIAITDSASTTTYDANWTKVDATDAVTSVNSQIGNVVLNADDIDDTSTTNKFTTAGDISKLAGIEASADVTDATNVAAAGAVMDSDFSANGVMERTGVGSYSTILHKRNATTAPTASDDASNTSGNGTFAVGSRWIDVTNDKEYVCVDSTATAAVWTETTQSGGGGGASDIVETVAAGSTSTEIQAAIDSAFAAGGGIVFLEAGTHTIATTVNVKANVFIQGAGIDKAIVACNLAGNNGAFSLDAAAPGFNKISDLTIRTAVGFGNFDTTHAIKPNASGTHIIERVRIDGYSNGKLNVALLDIRGQGDVVCRNCIFEYDQQMGESVIDIVTVKTALFENCIFDAKGSNSSFDRYLFKVTTTGGGVAVRIVNCNTETSSKWGVLEHKSYTYVECINNYLGALGGSIPQFSIQSNAVGRIAGNHMTGGSVAHLFDFVSSRNYLVENNLINLPTTLFADIEAGSYNTIIRNNQFNSAPTTFVTNAGANTLLERNYVQNSTTALT